MIDESIMDYNQIIYSIMEEEEQQPSDNQLKNQLEEDKKEETPKFDSIKFFTMLSKELISKLKELISKNTLVDTTKLFNDAIENIKKIDYTIESIPEGDFKDFIRLNFGITDVKGLNNLIEFLKTSENLLGENENNLEEESKGQELEKKESLLNDNEVINEEELQSDKGAVLTLFMKAFKSLKDELKKEIVDKFNKYCKSKPSNDWKSIQDELKGKDMQFSFEEINSSSNEHTQKILKVFNITNDETLKSFIDMLKSEKADKITNESYFSILCAILEEENEESETLKFFNRMSDFLISNTNILNKLKNIFDSNNSLNGMIEVCKKLSKLSNTFEWENISKDIKKKLEEELGIGDEKKFYRFLKLVGDEKTTKEIFESEENINDLLNQFFTYYEKYDDKKKQVIKDKIQTSKNENVFDDDVIKLYDGFMALYTSIIETLKTTKEDSILYSKFKNDTSEFNCPFFKNAKCLWDVGARLQTFRDKFGNNGQQALASMNESEEEGGSKLSNLFNKVVNKIKKIGNFIKDNISVLNDDSKLIEPLLFPIMQMMENEFNAMKKYCEENDKEPLFKLWGEDSMEEELLSIESKVKSSEESEEKDKEEDTTKDDDTEDKEENKEETKDEDIDKEELTKKYKSKSKELRDLLADKKINAKELYLKISDKLDLNNIKTVADLLDSDIMNEGWWLEKIEDLKGVFDKNSKVLKLVNELVVYYLIVKKEDEEAIKIYKENDNKIDVKKILGDNAIKLDEDKMKNLKGKSTDYKGEKNEEITEANLESAKEYFENGKPLKKVVEESNLPDNTKLSKYFDKEDYHWFEGKSSEEENIGWLKSLLGISVNESFSLRNFVNKFINEKIDKSEQEKSQEKEDIKKSFRTALNKLERCYEGIIKIDKEYKPKKSEE